MSKYSEYRKSVRATARERFFGECIKVSNKYFNFKRVIDDDNIILITNNIIDVKGNPVLVVGENKVVYLKDWCICKIHNYDYEINSYAVKLARQFFKTYTFKNAIDDFMGMEGTSTA